MPIVAVVPRCQLPSAGHVGRRTADPVAVTIGRNRLLERIATPFGDAPGLSPRSLNGLCRRCKVFTFGAALERPGTSERLVKFPWQDRSHKELMMKLPVLLASVTFLATPVSAQEAVDIDTLGADAAAETMMTSRWTQDVPTYRTPTETIARLEELGYSEIEEFDVEWGVYEIEAVAPNGNEVEVEISPETGQILEIEDNWF
jgi:hypothetical protein